MEFAVPFREIAILQNVVVINENLIAFSIKENVKI